jgi:glyoxylase-like metal-dependent hydrolase (beta-lactamase superfamily II)
VYSPKPLTLVLVSGAGVGLLTGVLGVGGGFLVVPALVMLVGLPVQMAVGTSLVVIAMNSIAGFLGHAGNGSFDFILTLIFTGAGLAGTFTGAKLSRRISSSKLQKAFASFVIMLAIFLLYDNLPNSTFLDVRRCCMFTQQFFVEGLGCASYLVGCEAKGIAAVIDPDRAIQKYLDVAQSRGLTITHIIETHLHADHVSGNTALAAHTAADIYVHAASGAEYAHKPLRHDDVIELGNIRLRVLHTPGHTPESITLLISDTTRAEEPWLALTGDTLFVGDIGRPDLVGMEAARGLAGDMHESLFEKILPLNDSLLIYPGHGAGSLCGNPLCHAIHCWAGKYNSAWRRALW